MTEKVSTVLSVTVQPGARRPGIVGRHGDGVKVRVAAPPERGRANQEVVDLLADRLGLPSGDVVLVAGRGSRHKKVRVRGLDQAACLARLVPVDPA